MTPQAQAILQTPRPVLLRKLLALGDLNEPELRDITRWPRDELTTAIAMGCASGAITYHHDGRGQRFYALKCPGFVRPLAHTNTTPRAAGCTATNGPSANAAP